MSAQRLTGATVLVTRPRERARELCFLLEDEGAEVVALPLLSFAPPEDPRPLRAAAEALHRFSWVVFTSQSGVEALVEAAREAGTLARLRGVALAAVGPSTRRALEAHGLPVRLTPDDPTGLGLAEALSAQVSADDELLLPVAEEARPEVADALGQLGARLTRVVAYRAIRSHVPEAQLAALVARPPSAILFGSPRTAESLLECLGDRARVVLSAARLVAIGPTTKRALEGLGLDAHVAAAPTPAALVDATVEALAASRPLRV